MQDLVKLLALYTVAIPPGQFPDGGIPNGHLYAEMMAHGVDLHTHNTLVNSFVTGRAAKDGKPLLSQSHHYLTWTKAGEEFRKQIILALTGEPS